MRATLIDANGVIHDLGDVDLSQSLAELRPDLAHLAPGSVLVTITDDRAIMADLAGPAHMVSPAYEFTASFASSAPRFGWPDPNRGGARKRRRGHR